MLDAGDLIGSSSSVRTRSRWNGCVASSRVAERARVGRGAGDRVMRGPGVCQQTQPDGASPGHVVGQGSIGGGESSTAAAAEIFSGLSERWLQPLRLQYTHDGDSFYVSALVHKP